MLNVIIEKKTNKKPHGWLLLEYQIILQQFNFLTYNSCSIIFMQIWTNNTRRLSFCPYPSHITFLQVLASDLHQSIEQLGHHLKFHETLKEVVIFFPNYFVTDHNINFNFRK